MIHEDKIDLKDASNIHNGVKIYRADIRTIKKTDGEDMAFSVFSPLFLLVLIIALYRFDYTLKIASFIKEIPSYIMSSKSRSTVQYGKKKV